MYRYKVFFSSVEKIINNITGLFFYPPKLRIRFRALATSPLLSMVCQELHWWPAGHQRGQQLQHQMWISGKVHYMRPLMHIKQPNLARKPRRDVTSGPKIGHVYVSATKVIQLFWKGCFRTISAAIPYCDGLCLYPLNTMGKLLQAKL